MPPSDFIAKHWLMGVILLFLVLNGLWMVQLAGRVTPAMSGEQAPVFELARLPLEGEPAAAPVTLEGLRGKVVVLDFWASWCGPCRQALPALAALDRQKRDEGLAVIGVLTDDDAHDVAAEMAHDLGVRYPVVVDESGVALRYGVENLPTVVVVDREGVIRATEVGARSTDDLLRLVEPLLRP